MDHRETNDIAKTLAEVLPKVELLDTIKPQNIEFFERRFLAVPKGAEVKEITVDLENLLPTPRRTKALAKFSDSASFVAYVKRHATEKTACWLDFNPQNYDLMFKAVIDEITKGSASWREHVAVFQPEMSAEWKAWIGKDKNIFGQLEFAEWIEEHADEITVPTLPDGSQRTGLPTSLQMLAMATNLNLTNDFKLASNVSTQSGGVKLEFIDQENEETRKAMELFKLFCIGIPVFQGASQAWGIDARLKYRRNGSKAMFFYELVRPDRTHQAAALKLIEEVRAGLGELPIFAGSCSANGR